MEWFDGREATSKAEHRQPRRRKVATNFDRSVAALLSLLVALWVFFEKFSLKKKGLR